MPDNERRELTYKINSIIEAGDAMARLAGDAKLETFPRTVTQEEARMYRYNGQKAMLSAIGYNVDDEQAQARLVGLMAGLVTELCYAAKLKREVFCNNLVSNVLYVALKAAYKDGKENGAAKN